MPSESKPHPGVESHSPPAFWLKRNMPSGWKGTCRNKQGWCERWMVLEIQVRLESTSPFSTLKINTRCQILLEKTSQALKIQKLQMLGNWYRTLCGVVGFQCEFFFFCTRGRGLWMNLGQLLQRLSFVINNITPRLWWAIQRGMWVNGL